MIMRHFVILCATSLAYGMAMHAELQPGPRPDEPLTIPLPSSRPSRDWSLGSTITYHNISIWPTLSSLGGTRPGVESESFSLIGVDESSPFEPTYCENNETIDAILDLAPGKTIDSPGVLGRQITLDQIDYVRMWTKRDFLTKFGHDWYISLYTALEYNGDDQGSFYNTLLQGETGYFPNRMPYDKAHLGEWMYTDTRTPANFSGTVKGETTSFFPGHPYILGSGFSWYDWNRCENIGFYTAPTLSQIMERDFTWTAYPHAGPSSTDPTTPYADKPLSLLRFQTSTSTPDWRTFVGGISRIELGIAFAEDDLHLITYDIQSAGPSPSPSPSAAPSGAPSSTPTASPSPRPPPPSLSVGWHQPRGDESNSGFFKGNLANSGKGRLEYALPASSARVSRSIRGPAAIKAVGNQSYVLTAGGVVYGLKNNATDFTTSWTLPLGQPGPRFMGPVLTHDEKGVVALTQNARMWLINSTNGQPLWSPTYRDLPRASTSDTAAAPLRITTVLSPSRQQALTRRLADLPPTNVPAGLAARAAEAQLARHEALQNGEAREVALATAGRRLYVVDVQTGDIRWMCDSATQTSFVGGAVASFVSPYLYAATKAGEVYAFDSPLAEAACPFSSTGPVRTCPLCAEWVSSTDPDHASHPEQAQPEPVDAPSVDYVSGRLLVGTKAGDDWGPGRVYAFDLGEHSPEAYVLFTSEAVAPTETDTGLLAAPTAGLIVAQNDASGSRVGQPILLAGDDVGFVYGVLVAQSETPPENGYPAAWKVLVGQSFDGNGVPHGTASSAVTNGTLVIYNTESQVVALDISTGDVRWSADHPSTLVPPTFLRAPAPSITRLGSVRVVTRGASVLTFAAGCPALTAPTDGSMTCKAGSNGLDVCTFKCNSNYFPSPTTHPMRAVCQLGGTWTAQPPLCNALQCNYNPYGSFGSCDVACGGGRHTRTRTVNSAVPPSGISYCTATSDTARCNTQNCPPPNAKSAPLIQFGMKVPATNPDDPFDSESFRRNTANAINNRNNQDVDVDVDQGLSSTVVEPQHILVTKADLVQSSSSSFEDGASARKSDFVVERDEEEGSTATENDFVVERDQDERTSTTTTKNDFVVEHETNERITTTTTTTTTTTKKHSSWLRRLQSSYLWDVGFRVEVPGATSTDLQVIATSLLSACSDGRVNGTCDSSSDLKIVSDPEQTYGSGGPTGLTWAEIGVIALGAVVVLLVCGLGCFAWSSRSQAKKLKRLERRNYLEHGDADTTRPLMDRPRRGSGGGGYGAGASGVEAPPKGEDEVFGFRHPAHAAARRRHSITGPIDTSAAVSSGGGTLRPEGMVSPSGPPKPLTWSSAGRGSSARVLPDVGASAPHTAHADGHGDTEGEEAPYGRYVPPHANAPERPAAWERGPRTAAEAKVLEASPSRGRRPSPPPNKPSRSLPADGTPVATPRGIELETEASPPAPGDEVEAVLAAATPHGNRRLDFAEEAPPPRRRSQDDSNQVYYRAPSPPPPHPHPHAHPELESLPPVEPEGPPAHSYAAPENTESEYEHAAPPMTRHHSDSALGSSDDEFHLPRVGTRPVTVDRPSRRGVSEPGRAGDDDLAATTANNTAANARDVSVSPPNAGGHWGHSVGPRRVPTRAKSIRRMEDVAGEEPQVPGSGRVPRRIRSRAAMIAAGVVSPKDKESDRSTDSGSKKDKATKKKKTRRGRSSSPRARAAAKATQATVRARRASQERNRRASQERTRAIDESPYAAPPNVRHPTDF